MPNGAGQAGGEGKQSEGALAKLAGVHEHYVAAASRLEVLGEDIAARRTHVSPEERAKRFKRSLAVELNEKMYKELTASAEDLASAQMWAKFDAVFTIIVLVNALLIGMQAEETPPPECCLSSCGSSPECAPSALEKIDDIFLVAFLVEYLFRLCTHPIDTIFSHWCALDLTVVLIGIVPKVLAVIGGGGANEDALRSTQVIRVLRVLKLLRLAKLVHLMREILLLVESIGTAFWTLLWSVLLLTLMVYIFAVILVVEFAELGSPAAPLGAVQVDGLEGAVTSGDYATDWQLLLWWGNLPGAMMMMLRLTTSDQWGYVVDLSSRKTGKPGLLVLFLVFWALSSLCVLNLVIGTMVHAARAAGAKEEKMTIMAELVSTQKRLHDMWEALRTCGNRPVFASPETITKSELKLELERAHNQRTLAKLGIKPAFLEPVFLAASKASGLIEIDGFVNGLVRMKGHLQSADIWSYIAHMEVSHHNSTMIGASCMRVVAMTHGIAKQVDAYYAEVKQKAENMAMGELEDAKPLEDLYHNRMSLGDQRLARIEAEKETQQVILWYRTEEMMWNKFDSFFGIFIVAFAVNMAYELEASDGNNGANEAVEILLLAVMMIEFGLRFALWRVTQSRPQTLPSFSLLKDALTGDSQPQRPPPPASRFFDGIICFDCMVIGVSTLEKILFTLVDGSMASTMMVLRIIRLGRLLRLLRLFKLFAKLWILVKAIALSLDTMMWAMFFLFLVIYMWSILVINLLRDFQDTPMTPLESERFGTLSAAMLTLFQVVTFDAWPEILRPFFEADGESAQVRHLIFGFLVLFIIIARLDVLNFLVGMMCQIAEHVTEHETKVKFRNEVAEMRVQMEHTLEKHHEGQNDKDPDAVSYISKDVAEMLFQTPTVTNIMAKMGLTSNDALMVLSRLDPGDTGKVRTDLWIEGCVRITAPPQGDDIYFLKVVTRQLEVELVETSAYLHELAASVEQLLSYMNKLTSVVSDRKKAVMSALGAASQKAGSAVRSVEELNVIRDKGQAALAGMRQEVKEGHRRVRDEEERTGHMNSHQQHDHEMDDMKLTPRTFWNYLEWGEMEAKLENTNETEAMEQEIHHLKRDIKKLEEEIAAFDVAGGDEDDEDA